MIFLPADVYQPDQWRDFFIMVGGGAAAITGLVFVAMTLNPGAILRDATHRSRAVGTLVGLVAVFVICGFGLMGSQNHISLGLEWLAATLVTAYVYYRGIFVTRRGAGHPVRSSPARIATGSLAFALQIAGTVWFAAGHAAGLYLAAFTMIVYVPYMISGAWLLLVAAHQD
jgi:hypothetical protein